MFSIQNNNPEIVFAFSSELQNNFGVGLARDFLRKGEFNLEVNNLEQMVRRCIFPDMPRKRIKKLCLRMFRVINKLSKSEMENYGVEFTEEWKMYGTNYDITRAMVKRVKVIHEKVRGRGYLALPTYYPDYLRSVI